jgi:hypothetical protein
MKYFLDTEFNGFGGDLISLALVGEDYRELYISTPCEKPVEWVAENVMPIIRCHGAEPFVIDPTMFGRCIASFLDGDPNPVIVADWPDDIRYFCQALIVGPGQMVNIPGPIGFEIHRVDSYPTTFGAIQHNALWDARALRRVLA